MSDEHQPQQQPPESDDKSRQNTTGAAADAASVAADAAAAELAVEDLQDQAARLADELQQTREHALRAQAELENVRKRMRREMEEERRYAALPLIVDLLPVLDNLERALSSAETNESGAGLKEGVKMVASQMQAVLERHHCRKIEAQGASFDPNLHEAIAHMPAAEHEPGTVMEVALEGYQLHDRVVRPAQVVVAKAVEEES